MLVLLTGVISTSVLSSGILFPKFSYLEMISLVPTFRVRWVGVHRIILSPDLFFLSPLKNVTQLPTPPPKDSAMAILKIPLLLQPQQKVSSSVEHGVTGLLCCRCEHGADLNAAASGWQRQRLFSKNTPARGLLPMRPARTGAGPSASARSLAPQTQLRRTCLRSGQHISTPATPACTLGARGAHCSIRANPTVRMLSPISTKHADSSTCLLPAPERTGQGRSVLTTEGTSQRRAPGPSDLGRPRSSATPEQNLHTNSLSLPQQKLPGQEVLHS